MKLAMLNAKIKLHRVNQISKRYAALKESVSEQEAEIEKLKVELTALLGDQNSFETSEYVVTRSEQERRSFDLKTAVANLGESILSKFIQTTTYSIVRVKEKATQQVHQKKKLAA